MAEWPDIPAWSDEAIEYEPVPDFHAVVTIQLGELYIAGFFDYENDPSWRWDAYSDEQYTRVMGKILNHYFYREIGVLPPGRWKTEFMRKMNEVMPKYKPLYEQLEAGLNPLAESDEYGKSRDIYSDFPQSQLSDNQDYASNGRDREYENVRLGNVADAVQRLATVYNDADVLIIKELESLFSCLQSVDFTNW
jgi:hypothetical protein